MEESVLLLTSLTHASNRPFISRIPVVAEPAPKTQATLSEKSGAKNISKINTEISTVRLARAFVNIKSVEKWKKRLI